MRFHRLSHALPALAAAVLAMSLSTMPQNANAQPACRNTGDFGQWMANFRRQAVKSGVSQRTLSSALDDITFDPGIIRRDRGQSFFAQSFLSFQGKLATKNRVSNSKSMLVKHRALFDRVEKEYGVRGTVITGFWALESDFGKGMGKLSVLRSLATLAYDCRRGEMFTGELMAALRIIERGDVRPDDMVGSWAGELGQTQFLPTLYEKYALDYDGDGKRDLFRSVPDIIASSAAYIRAEGWKPGQPWLEEVTVPARLPWDQATLSIQHPRSKWSEWGVRRRDGQPLPQDDMPASLLLLMGRNGPAFLAYPNFRVYTEWNKSLNYATTAAYLATRIEGAPEMSHGRAPVEVLEPSAIKELQTLLTRKIGDVGPIDGKIGNATREGVRKAQMKVGLPADSYPTTELLERLRRLR